jgi:hypothetical protein
MLSMLALSLRHDLRLRDELRARGLLDAVPPRGVRLAAVQPEATELHLPARTEREETLAFSADDHTARFRGDGAGEPPRFQPGVPADDPTLVHRREPDPR